MVSFEALTCQREAIMKLILVLLVLASRELITETWRDFLTKPSYWWRDLWIEVAAKKQLSAPLVLALLSLLPVIVYGIIFLWLQDKSIVWQFLWGAIILVSVFIDRRLPSVLSEARRVDLQLTPLLAQDMSQVRLQLFECALKELFTPLFWIFLLGPWGVLLVSVYYSCRICQEQSQHLPLKDIAERCLFYLHWLPSRALVLSFALVGQFAPVWRYLSISYQKKIEPLTLIEQAAALAEAENIITNTESTWLATLAAYEALCFRVIVLWVILLVLQII